MIKTIRYWIIKVVGISKGEANALLILVPLMIVIIVTMPIIRSHNINRYSNYVRDQAILDSMISSMQYTKVSDSKSNTNKQISYAAFDPNNCSLDLLVSNGIPQFLAERIISYRSKGGQFRKKEDLQKIYGFDDQLYTNIYPYIQIVETNIAKSNKPFYPKSKKKKFTIQPFDINSADTATLRQIYGIGDKLSLRIVNFRDKLGGFMYRSQLSQVYGLDSVVVDSLMEYGSISGTFNPNRLNVNTDTIKHLSSHPYIDYKVAKAIVNYRRQHGDYKSVEDIKKVYFVDDSLFNRISIYLKLRD